MTTRSQTAALDAAIITAVTDEHPVTLRGVFYRVSSASAVDKPRRATAASGAGCSRCAVTALSP